jgi:hypothetical protein
MPVVGEALLHEPRLDLGCQREGRIDLARLERIEHGGAGTGHPEQRKTGVREKTLLDASAYTAAHQQPVDAHAKRVAAAPGGGGSQRSPCGGRQPEGEIASFHRFIVAGSARADSTASPHSRSA